jgi:hypothetical protein
MAEARKVLHDRIGYADSAEDCLRQSNVAIIINPMREFEQLDWSAARQTCVLDPWRCLSAAAIASVGRYKPLGHGDDSDDSRALAENFKARMRQLIA